MVKQNAGDCVQTIRIAVRPNSLMCRYLGYSIRAYWIKERLGADWAVSTRPYISLLGHDRIGLLLSVRIASSRLITG